MLRALSIDDVTVYSKWQHIDIPRPVNSPDIYLISEVDYESNNIAFNRISALDQLYSHNYNFRNFSEIFALIKEGDQLKLLKVKRLLHELMLNKKNLLAIHNLLIELDI